MKIRHLTVGPGGTNCYVASDGENAVAIDPGFEAERVVAYLSRQKLRLHYIFLTHGHYDHILAAPALREMTGAEIVITAPDSDCLTDPRRSLAARMGLQQRCEEANILAFENSIFLVGEMSFRWMLTPGHTPGSAVILSEDVIFAGDTLFAGSCGRCDLPGGNEQRMRESLRRLGQLPGEYQVYPGHGGDTTLDRERKYNRNMKEALGI